MEQHEEQFSPERFDFDRMLINSHYRFFSETSTPVEALGVTAINNRAIFILDPEELGLLAKLVHSATLNRTLFIDSQAIREELKMGEFKWRRLIRELQLHRFVGRITRPGPGPKLYLIPQSAEGQPCAD